MMRERFVEELLRVIAAFINKESNRRSMITVTEVVLDQRGKHANVFISVYPDKDLRAAVEFLERQRNELRDYLTTHIRVRSIPHLSFLPSPTMGTSPE